MSMNDQEHTKWSDINKCDVKPLTDALWDMLRMDCCATKLNAKRIVMLNKDDVVKAIGKLVSKPKESNE